MKVDLANSIEKATQDYIQSDKMKEHINKKAEEMVNSIIDNSLGYYGEIKKQVEEQIKDKLKINVDDLGISGHNKFITEIVKDKISKSLKEDAVLKINKELSKILEPVEKVVTVQRLKEELWNSVYKGDFDICGDPTFDDVLDSEQYYEDDLFTMIFETPKEDRYDWIDIYIDSKAGVSKHSCEFNITAHKNFMSLRQNGSDLKAKNTVFNSKFDFEDFFYKMFLNDSIIDYEDAKGYL